jgi:anti-sigma-K factor RskA
LRRQLRFWRGTAAIATAFAAMLAIWIAERSVNEPGVAQTYVAVLQQGNGAPTFVVSLDLARRRMSVRPLGTAPPSDKSYELWMIGGDAKPRSMGLVDSDAPQRPNVPDVDQSVLSGATYAVTLEPRGGSPTGQPTSAPLFVGKMLNAAL